MKKKLKRSRMRDVTLRQLRVLQQIAHSGKITASASELGVTLPAVALQFKLLEQAVWRRAL